ncbi:MAG TPA: hypothetical protein VGL66_02595 [Caulobacteraceae bacterium]|jgi:hypothetical protein
MRFLFGLVLSLAATAALADTPPNAASPSQAAQAPQTPPLSIWVPEKDGYRHLQSGLVCPASLEGYQRTDASIFDNYGLDVGCNYSGHGRGVTLYLTRRAGSGIDAAMTEAKRELAQLGADRHPQLISDKTVSANGLNWMVSLYGEDGGAHSSIWIADLGGWTLEFRATYPAADEDATVADLATMADAAKASAGPTLDACAKSQTPERRGSLITDQKSNASAAMMTSLLGGGAMAAADDPKTKDAVKEEPLFWCPEAPLQSGRNGMLFWRAVKADGSDGRSDRISLMTQDEPPVMVIAADSLADLINAVEKKKSDIKEPDLHWSATLTTKKQVLIFGYFNDRPSPDHVVELFDQVLSGKAKALGGYSVDGKNITISMPDK